MRRILINSGSGGTSNPSKIVFKISEGSTVPIYASGAGITVKNEAGNTVATMSSGTLSNPSLGYSIATGGETFTLEADRLNRVHFKYANSLVSVSELNVPLPNTDLNQMFYGCYNLTEVRNISISTVSAISGMFSNCNNLVHVDDFEIKPGSGINEMFYSTKISRIPILNPEVASTADYAFYQCQMLSDISRIQNIDLAWTSFVQVVGQYNLLTELSNIRLINSTSLHVTNAQFLSIHSIYAPKIKGIQITNCNNLTTINDIYAPEATSLLFRSNPALTTVTNLNTAPITSMSDAFAGCTSLQIAPQINISTSGCLFTNAFSRCSSLYDISTIVNAINAITVNNIRCDGTFQDCGAITALPSIDFSKLINCQYMFSGTGITTLSNVTLYANNVEGMFYYCTGLTSATNITLNDMITASSMFAGCSNMLSATVSVSTNEAAASYNSMFSDCASMTNLQATLISNNINTGIAQLDNMCYSCTSLTSVSLSINQKYSAQSLFYNCAITAMPIMDYSLCVNADSMFNSSEIASIGNIEFTLALNASSIFANCSELINVGNLSFPQCTSADGIFYNCSLLQNIQGLNLQLVEGISNPFYRCINLQSASVYANILTHANSMFKGCSILTSVILDAPLLRSASYMYQDCSLLTSATINSPFVTNMNYCFNNCTALTTVNMAPSDSSVTEVTCESAFANCQNLSSLSNMPMEKITNGYQTFYHCSSLQLNLSNIIFSNLHNAFRMFSYSAIQSINNVTVNCTSSYFNAANMFFSCDSLSSINNFTINNMGTSGDISFMFLGCDLINDISTISFNGNMSARSVFTDCAFNNLNVVFNGIGSSSYMATFINTIPSLTNINHLEVGGYAEVLVDNCVNLQTLGTLRLNSNNIVDCSFISNCHNLVSIDTLHSNSTGNCQVVDLNSLLTINIMNIPNATSVSLRVPTLKSVNQIIGNSLTYLEGFAKFSSLENLPIMNTNNVTTFMESFMNTKITSYNGEYNLSSAVSIYGMFKSCPNLTSVTINDSFINSTVDASEVLSNCPLLTSVYITDASKFRGSDLFLNSNAITDLVINGYVITLNVPPLITDVTKLESIINSAGIALSGSVIVIGSSRLATISSTVINNAISKGWSIV